MSPRGGRPGRVRPREADEGRSRLRALRFAGVRAGTLLGTAAAVYLFFPAARGSDTPLLERGAVAREDVVARIPFQIAKSPDELRREQEQAAAGVPPVLRHQPAAVDSTVAELAGFFADVEAELAQAEPQEEVAAVRRALARGGIPTTLGAIDVLRDPPRRDAVRTATEAALQQSAQEGYTAVNAARPGVAAVRVREAGGRETLLPAAAIPAGDSLFALAARQLAPEAGPDAAELQRLLLVRYFHPTLVPDEGATEAARGRARGAVDPVKARVLAGEKIIGAREQVGPAEEERLRAYQSALDQARVGDGGHSLPRASGALLFNLLLLGIIGFVLRLSRLRLYRDDRAVIFLGFLVVAVAAMASGVARAGLPPELIPVPFAAVLTAVLWGGRLALALALVLALLLGGQGPFLGIAVPFTAAVGGSAAAFGVRLAQRRLQTWMVVGVIAAAYAACALSIGLMRAQGWAEVGWASLWGLANAIASSLLAVGFLPVAEWFTRVTTQQTLMELADPKHPLLRRLSMEAPGTYAHTIAVANLSEAVCNAIGADALLARVGVYYHDIGKISKPHYFIENQPRGRNPHDKLKPSMSAAIVRSHVQEGLRLADEHRLPEVVKAFIAQHHGTQVISFFLDQARSADPEARINASEYQYHGPRPQTKEVAVVMLADSVESAARALPDPTPERIRDLVERIVGAKVAKGQLDQSPLTLHDLYVTRTVLAKALTGMYHQRIDYPPAPAEALAPEPTSITG
jgi:cyclic-di-AMP phosphodiesterase PgpH